MNDKPELIKLKETANSLGGMYAQLYISAYKELVSSGFADEQAKVIALEIFKQHILMSVANAKQKREDVSGMDLSALLMSLMNAKGGSA